MYSIPGKPSRMLSMSVPEKASPRATPNPRPSSATKEDSIRKANRTCPFWKPRARIIPICWRLSTTASRDHAQSADADHQPQAHETPQEQKDDPARRVAVPDDLGSQLCLEAVLGEVLLQ